MTITISDETMSRLRAEAARRGRDVPEVIEEVLREHAVQEEQDELPVHDGGRVLIDIADRRALYDALDDR